MPRWAWRLIRKTQVYLEPDVEMLYIVERERTIDTARGDKDRPNMVVPVTAGRPIVVRLAWRWKMNDPGQIVDDSTSLENPFYEGFGVIFASMTSLWWPAN